MTTWILLRGLAREAAHWGTFTAELAARLAPGDRAVALDLPGNGQLHRQCSPASVPAIAAACRIEAATHALPRPYLLVAMSLGAMVALEWAQRHPEELAGCVLINTSARGFGRFWERMRPRSYPMLLRALWPGSADSEREVSILTLTSSDPQRHTGVLAAWLEIAAKRPVARANILRQLIAAARFRPARAVPAVALLLLACERDALVSPQCSRRMARRWLLPLHLHPQAGHDLALDDPDWLLERIVQWRSVIER